MHNGADAKPVNAGHGVVYDEQGAPRDITSPRQSEPEDPLDTTTGYWHISYEQLQRSAPAAVAALLDLSKAVDASGLEKSLTELVKVRVSQLNACAFCLVLHLNTARRIGVAPHKLDLLPVWRETSVFSARERAALAWAEALTLLPLNPASAQVLEEVTETFTESETMHLGFAIAGINAWNRIAGGLRFEPASLLRGA